MSNRSSILAVVLCMMAPVATCVAPSYASYNIVKSSDTLGYNQSWTPRNIYAVDVKNDGIPDLIQDMDSGEFTVGLGQFGVSIANGDESGTSAVLITRDLYLAT